MICTGKIPWLLTKKLNLRSHEGWLIEMDRITCSSCRRFENERFVRIHHRKIESKRPLRQCKEVDTEAKQLISLRRIRSRKTTSVLYSDQNLHGEEANLVLSEDKEESN